MPTSSKKALSKKPPVPISTPRSMRIIALGLVATGALLWLDLGTKNWAESTLSTPLPGDPPPVCEPDEYGFRRWQRAKGDVVVLIEDHLELRYAENCGAAFGMGSQASPWVRKVVFGIAAVAASGALLFMFVQGRGTVWFALSVPMIVSGALGNLIDRLRFGYVVDFIRAYNLHLPYLNEWPTFNVADIGITVGVGLLVLDGFRQPKEETANPEGEAAATGSSEAAGN